MKRPLAAAVVVLVVLVAVVLPAPLSASAADRPPGYVALGDSYTAAPGVLPMAPGAPLECLRSSVNYPHLTAAALDLTLTDRSCSGAATANMTTPQYPGVAPQFGALTPTTSVVSIGIGGNDNQLFLTSLIFCNAIDALNFFGAGAPCHSLFGDLFVNEANNDGPVVGQALAAIHLRSPNAKVFVVGYPDDLPQSGSCYPQLLLTTGDVAFLNNLEMAINAMLQAAATANGATFVDTFAASIGHDACKAVGTRWVEPLIAETDGFLAHPNATGEKEDAHALESALRAAGFS